MILNVDPRQRTWRYKDASNVHLFNPDKLTYLYTRRIDYSRQMFSWLLTLLLQCVSSVHFSAADLHRH